MHTVHPAATWSPPYFGVSHLTAAGKQSRLTIAPHGDRTQLQRWYPGCRLSPSITEHATEAEAKAVGEQWLAGAA